MICRRLKNSQHFLQPTALRPCKQLFLDGSLLLQRSISVYFLTQKNIVHIEILNTGQIDTSPLTTKSITISLFNYILYL